MNKKGFTLVELIVSIVLVSVVMVSMLMALVKLRENYSTVNENANALVYSNAASRIINNDILQNDGIKNVSCSANHLNCDVVLGNGNKRQLQIVELAESFSSLSSEDKVDKCKKYCNGNSKTNENCNCNGKKAIGIIETKKTSLVYYDTTKEKKLKYIKTFELETKTQIDSNDNLGTSTISGYSFLSLDTKYNTYKSNIDGYENKLATVVVRTYNGYDAEDRTYDIKMYSNSTYSKDSQLAGTVFKLKIIDDGDIKKASPDSFYLKYDVGYYKDLDGDEIDSLDNVSSKAGYTLIRYDDSNGHEVIDKSGNFLSKIAFDNTNTSKKEGEIRPVWSANTYVVSFNPGKGTLDGDSNKDVVYDGTYGDLPTASRPGYSFDGWYTSETGGSKVTSDTPVKITNNQTLYAHWTPNKYTVTFDGNGGTMGSTTKKTMAYDTKYDFSGISVSRTGYTFVGWFTAASGGTQVTTDTKVKITANQTLYAHWVDKTAPTCVVTKSNQSSTGLTLTVKCTDAGSGCVEATKTYNNVTTSQTYQVKDKAGNVTTCDTATVAKATVYRKRTCSSCNSCNWVTRYSCSKGTLINRNCVWTVTKNCSNCPNCTLDHWDSSAKVTYYTCSQSAVASGGYYNNPNDCGTCGCGSWGDWSSYNLSSCAGSSSVQCESTTIYQ